MTNFAERLRKKFPFTADAPSQHVGLRQIELQEETNRLLVEILRRMPTFAIVPLPTADATGAGPVIGSTGISY